MIPIRTQLALMRIVMRIVMRSTPTRCRAARSYAISKGIPFTPTRQRVLALLAATGKPMAAYEIAEKLSGSRKVQAVHIYRALEFLQEAGRVHRLVSRSAFFACDHRHAETHYGHKIEEQSR